LTVTRASSAIPTAPSPGGGSGGGGQQQGITSNTSLANSASLYLYTFLATLVLLLSVSGAIVVRSFILRRRHRRMVEEAIRNGTYVAPTPPTRPARVDLSQKPELWEAYLGDGGWRLGSGKELDNWKLDYSRDWESIKPLCAGYAAPLNCVPYSGSTPNLTSLSPPVYTPAPTSTNPSAARGDDEENQRTGATPSLGARIFSLFPNSTLPASSTADNGINAHSNSNNISLTELSSNSPPTAVRVAVLIAMPSSSSHGSTSSISSQAGTTSHPHQLSSSPTIRDADDEEHLLPHLEMGVADVVIGRSENSSTSDSRKDGKTINSRGSSYAES